MCSRPHGMRSQTADRNGGADSSYLLLWSGKSPRGAAVLFDRRSMVQRL